MQGLCNRNLTHHWIFSQFNLFEINRQHSYDGAKVSSGILLGSGFYISRKKDEYFGTFFNKKVKHVK